MLPFVQNRIAYTCEDVSFFVFSSTEVPVLNQLQKHLMNRILSLTSFACNSHGKQKESRAVLAV